MERDPLTNLRTTAIQQGLATAQDFDTIDAQVKQKIDEAVVFADRSPYPALSEVDTDVYAVATA